MSVWAHGTGCATTRWWPSWQVPGENRRACALQMFPGLEAKWLIKKDCSRTTRRRTWNGRWYCVPTANLTTSFPTAANERPLPNECPLPRLPYLVSCLKSFVQLRPGLPFRPSTAFQPDSCVVAKASADWIQSSCVIKHLADFNRQ